MKKQKRQTKLDAPNIQDGLLLDILEEVDFPASKLAEYHRRLPGIIADFKAQNTSLTASPKASNGEST